MPEIISSIVFILLAVLLFLFSFLGFPSPRFPQLCFLSCLYYHLQVLNCFIHFLHLFDCIFLYILRGLLIFSLKISIFFIRLDLKTFLCFDCVRISRASYSSRIPGLWMCHIDLIFIDCVLMLAFNQLVIPGYFWHRSPEVGSVCLDIGNQDSVCFWDTGQSI